MYFDDIQIDLWSKNKDEWKKIKKMELEAEQELSPANRADGIHFTAKGAEGKHISDDCGTNQDQKVTEMTQNAIKLSQDAINNLAKDAVSKKFDFLCLWKNGLHLMCM